MKRDGWRNASEVCWKEERRRVMGRRGGGCIQVGERFLFFVKRDGWRNAREGVSKEERRKVSNGYGSGMTDTLRTSDMAVMMLGSCVTSFFCLNALLGI